MGITPTTLSGTITTSAMQTELNRVRNWINTGIVVGDFDAAGLDETHVYRPDVSGFPKQGLEGQTQDVYEAHLDPGGNTYTNQESQGTGFESVAKSRERISIFLDYVDEDGLFRIAESFRRVVLDETSDVTIAYAFEFTSRTDTSGSPVAHPNTCGKVLIRYHNVGTGTTSSLTESRRRLTSRYIAGTEALGGNAHEVVGSIEDLAAGTYDIFLEYGLNGASTNISQVIISTLDVLVEVHKQ